MISVARLAWLQLRRDKIRLLVALAGVAFAVLLMLMQFGFQDALFRSAVNVHQHLNGDIFLVNPHSTMMATPKMIPRRRLYQALAFDGVEAVTPIYTNLAQWKNPATGMTRSIFVVGVDPAEDVFDLPDIAAQRALIRYPDVVLYDALSRPDFGPVAQRFRAGEEVHTEANNRGVTVRGLFRLGTSFGIDGTLVTSDLNLMRVFPERSPGALSIGLVRLRRGADPDRVRATLAAALPRDVLVLTKRQYMDREVAYWAETTPIGYVFKFGVLMGLAVGAIIVYQILFADISDHLAEYATLKAMGYTNRYLAGVVLTEASMLAVIGFVPGLGVSAWLYQLTRGATNLPMAVTPDRAAHVLALSAVMCWVSGLIAMRKLRAADPADVF